MTDVYMEVLEAQFASKPSTNQSVTQGMTSWTRIQRQIANFNCFSLHYWEKLKFPLHLLKILINQLHMTPKLVQISQPLMVAGAACNVTNHNIP